MCTKLIVIVKKRFFAPAISNFLFILQIPLRRRRIEDPTTKMPPKNAGPSKKTEQKAKAKIIEDKTFGLKNKNKSAKVNQYIKTLEAQVKNMGNAKKAKVGEGYINSLSIYFVAR